MSIKEFQLLTALQIENSVWSARYRPPEGPNTWVLRGPGTRVMRGAPVLLIPRPKRLCLADIWTRMHFFACLNVLSIHHGDAPYRGIREYDYSECTWIAPRIQLHVLQHLWMLHFITSITDSKTHGNTPSQIMADAITSIRYTWSATVKLQ